MDHILVAVLLFVFNAVCLCDESPTSDYSEQPEKSDVAEGNLESNASLGNASLPSEATADSTGKPDDSADSVAVRALKKRRKNLWSKNSKSTKTSKGKKLNDKTPKSSVNNSSTDKKTTDKKELNTTSPDVNTQERSGLGESNSSNIEDKVSDQSNTTQLKAEEAKNSSLIDESIANRNIEEVNIHTPSAQADIDKEDDLTEIAKRTNLEYGSNSRKKYLDQPFSQPEGEDSVDVRSQNMGIDWRRKEGQYFENGLGKLFDNGDESGGRSRFYDDGRAEVQFDRSRLYGRNNGNGLRYKMNSNLRTHQIYSSGYPNPYYTKQLSGRPRYIGKNRFSEGIRRTGEDGRLGPARFYHSQDADQIYTYPETALRGWRDVPELHSGMDVNRSPYYTNDDMTNHLRNSYYGYNDQRSGYGRNG